MNTIDLRSDTVTRPTAEMRNAMYLADVGDDVYGDDMTVKQLEQRVAQMFGKPAALFFPSGTMSNLAAILTWCNERGSEIVVGNKSHIFLFEQSSASQFGGVSYRTLDNLHDGTFDIKTLCDSIREDDIHESKTKLICIENTHNACGGKILPFEFMKNVKQTGELYKIPVHMDGARIWNAIEKSKISPDQIGSLIDSISVCLSKGLGAPAGTILCGTSEFIQTAKRYRKALGGGMRQIGILAAAGMQAIDDFEKGILVHDHHHAKLLATEIEKMHIFKNFDKNNIDTNIIFAYIHEPMNAKLLYDILKINRILISVWAPNLIRFVLHRDIELVDIEYVINILYKINKTYQNITIQNIAIQNLKREITSHKTKLTKNLTNIAI